MLGNVGIHFEIVNCKVMALWLEIEVRGNFRKSQIPATEYRLTEMRKIIYFYKLLISYKYGKRWYKGSGAKINAISRGHTVISIYTFYNEGLTVLCAKNWSSTLTKIL